MITALTQLLQSMVDDPEMSTDKATAKAKTALTLVSGLSNLYQFLVMEATCPLCMGELHCRTGCALKGEFASNFIRIEAVRNILKASSRNYEVEF